MLSEFRQRAIKPAVANRWFCVIARHKRGHIRVDVGILFNHLGYWINSNWEWGEGSISCDYRGVGVRERRGLLSEECD
jgi:hypothetical protein